MSASSITEISPHPLVSRPRGVARRLVISLWMVAALLAIGSIVIVIVTLSTPAPEAGYLRGSVALFAFAWATIGARIAERHPRNAVGWLMLSAGIGFGIVAVTQELVIAALVGPTPIPSAEVTVRLVRVSGFLTSLAAGLTVLLFPDGHLASRRWLLIGILVVALNLLGVLIAMTASLPRLSGVGDPFLEAEDAYLQVPAYVLARYGGPLALVACGGSLFARYRRAAGVEREQLKWVVAGGGLALITNLAANALPPFALLQVIQLLTLLAIPISVGIGMAYYHLYDIDAILDRALVYAIVSALLAGLTAALLGAIQRLFIAVTGQSSDAAIVITTLILVAVLGSVRDQVQRFIDQRLRRGNARLTGLRTLAVEVRQHATLSDPQRVLMRLLSESVAEFGAAGGAAELVGPKGQSTQIVGDWAGDSRVTTTIKDDGRVIACIRLGPRSNGEAYSKRQVAKLREAANAVAEALAEPGSVT